MATAAVVAVPLYPDGASAFQQAGISSAAVVVATLGLVLIILLGNWVSFSARGQRDEAGKEVERLRQHEDWLSLIRNITKFIWEGNQAMEAKGRPQHRDDSGGLDFMNEWLPRVIARLPYEYQADFESQGRKIFEGDAVWVMQLDVRLERLREIVADIRTRHL